MANYEYRTIKVPGSFRNQQSIDLMDKSINETSANGWELVSTAAVGNSSWTYGKTNCMLLTFRRPVRNVV